MAIPMIPVGNKCQYARMLIHQDVRMSIFRQVIYVISISKATRSPKSRTVSVLNFQQNILNWLPIFANGG